MLMCVLISPNQFVDAICEGIEEQLQDIFALETTVAEFSLEHIHAKYAILLFASQMIFVLWYFLLLGNGAL